MFNKSKNYLSLLIGIIILLFVIGSLYSNSKKFEFNKVNDENFGSTSVNFKSINPWNGIECENANRRPIAVMLAGDQNVRPLSGLSLADLIIEAPVVTNGINRFMAIYICNEPEDIGSIRSARHDFIPLAKGFDAIYVHWGGSHFALDQLNKGIIDNIDALKNPYDAFYRKTGIPMPDNGFSTFQRLYNAASKLGYRLFSNVSGYKFIADNAAINENKILKINYPYPYNVYYEYNARTNTYLRFRGNTPEIDKLNKKQIEAKDIVVMFTDSKQIEGQYNDLDLEGSGKAIVFQNGLKIDAIWHKDSASFDSKLYFLDNNGEEIKFVAGQIWIEIVQLNTKIEWQ